MVHNGDARPRGRPKHSLICQMEFESDICANSTWDVADDRIRWTALVTWIVETDRQRNEEGERARASTLRGNLVVSSAAACWPTSNCIPASTVVSSQLLTSNTALALRTDRFMKTAWRNPQTAEIDAVGRGQHVNIASKYWDIVAVWSISFQGHEIAQCRDEKYARPGQKRSNTKSSSEFFYSASALLAMQGAVLARGILSVRPSVCPSVRPSVTFRYCVQTNEDTIVRFSAPGRTIPLVSGEVKFIRIFAWNHPQRGVKVRHPSIDRENSTNNWP